MYWPGVSKDSDPFAHPLYLLERVSSVTNFDRLLLRKLAGAAALRYEDPPELLHLRNQYRDQKYIELRRNAQDADDFLKALSFAEEERDRYRTRAQEREDEILILKENLKAISIGSLGIDELPTDDPTKGLSEAQTVIEAVELAKTRCNNVVFLESAYASARGSPYQQPQKVLHALLALDDVMKNWIDSLTSKASYGSWEDQMKKRGFE